MSTITSMMQAVGFVPTGWMYEMKRSTFPMRSKGPCTVHLVPYSEHSSYEELREYVRFLKPHQVRPRSALYTDDKQLKACAPDMRRSV